MTCFTLLSVFSFAIKSAFDVLGVNVAVVSLAWEVAIRMTIETARMFKDGHDGGKQLARACVVALNCSLPANKTQTLAVHLESKQNKRNYQDRS
jgi:hypothetical protein